MRLVVSEFVTLDGVMEDPGGAEGFDRGGWAFKFDRGPEGDKFKLDELMAADALLLGRRTYEGFAAAWPSMKDEAGFADKMNGMPKFVVSKTLESADWSNSTLLRGDVETEVSRLRQQPGGDLLVAGSCQLVQALTSHGLVDEYRLMVFPILLGKGKRLFADGTASSALSVVEARTSGAVVTLRLQPVGENAAGA
ncbi:MAG: dihydrofolate reductase family protein [Gaiellaceae bacterium]